MTKVRKTVIITVEMDSHTTNVKRRLKLNEKEPDVEWIEETWAPDNDRDSEARQKLESD